MVRDTVALIPCHNGAQWIGAAIKSLDFEYIVVYLDGCTDDSEKVLQSYPYVTCVNGPKLKSCMEVRNKLLHDYCPDAKYVCAFDCDDIRIPGRLEEQVRHLEENNLDCSIGQFIGLVYQSPGYKLQPFPIAKSLKALLENRYLQTGGILWKKSALDLLSQPWDESIPRLQDYWLIFKALRSGLKVGLFGKCTHFYRVLHSNLNMGASQYQPIYNSLYPKIDEELDRLQHLLQD